MRVAITAQGPDLNSAVDRSFGRARYFVVVDTESGEFSMHDNGVNAGAVHGAGTRAAQVVVGLGADAVITENVGHKAFATLQVNNIKVYQRGSGTVQEAMKELMMGRLEAMNTANVTGHWREPSR